MELKKDYTLEEIDPDTIEDFELPKPQYEVYIYPYDCNNNTLPWCPRLLAWSTDPDVAIDEAEKYYNLISTSDKEKANYKEWFSTDEDIACSVSIEVETTIQDEDGNYSNAGTIWTKTVDL